MTWKCPDTTGAGFEFPLQTLQQLGVSVGQIARVQYKS
jgi:hypothetical protein